MTKGDFKEWILSSKIIIWNDFEYHFICKIIGARCKVAEWGPISQILYPATVKCLLYGDLIYIKYNDWSGIPENCNRSFADFVRLLSHE
jgi:hypothetical protein